MRKTKFKRNVKAFFALTSIVLSVLLCFQSSGLFAFAAGSRNLTATQSGSTWVSNNGYRPYTEWYGSSTAGIARHQILKVYVNSGETLYFGSSISAGIGGDIVVRRPDGTSNASWDLDVVNNGKGYIGTRAKEMAGPNYPSSGNTAGYTPLSISVDQTGIWEFEFHSTGNGTLNPTPALTTAEFAANQSTGTVAAWDITVVKSVSGVPTVVPGRVFANFLSFNMGINKFGSDMLYATVYVLTKDGYVYQTNFNGLDPYGFIFFANNRGLINSKYNISLYQSGIAADNNLSPITSNGIDAQFQSPVNADTILDSTYKIFFEKPADDLPTDLKPTPYAPGRVTDFVFNGISNNLGYVGSGGYFTFNVTRASSYQVKLDFTKYRTPSGTIENRGVVYLANACVEGLNRVFWDGKDGTGQIVPAGTYGGTNSGIEVTVTIKAGEYHFPMFDAENNRNGIIIKLISDPLNSLNEKIPLTNAERATVYYNNSYLPKFTVEDSGAALNQMNGIDSTNGASKYGTTVNGPGDFGAIDIWTYFKGETTQIPINPENFQLIEAPVNKASLRGFVFYDAVNLGAYKMLDGDYALPGVTVGLYKSGTLVTTAVTDSSGFYTFSNIDYGTYEVRVVKPYDYATCTTSNLFQTVSVSSSTVSSGWATAANVGFTYSKYDKKITVVKNWAVSRTEDSLQPDSVTVHVLGKKGTTVEVTKTAVLSSANGWQYSFSDLPKYANDGVTLLTYEASEDTVNGYVQTGITTTTSTTEIKYTITNTPKGRISLTKTDESNSTLLLAGAVFELWKKGTPNTLITTKTTDSTGKIFVSGLDEGTYYFKEITAPSGYVLNTSVTSDITVAYTAAGYSKSVTVTNKLGNCSFTLIKTITSASDQEEQFAFAVTGPSGVSYAVLTIPAGQTTVSQKFAEMPTGTYSITEMSTNWRYTVKTDQTLAGNGTNTFPYTSGKLTMQLTDPLNSNYTFTFVNEKTNTAWVDGHSHVTNTMNSP